jgi:hypothetical protein
MPTGSRRPPVSPPRAPAHGFRTIHIPCAASIVKANFTFAFSSSHFALRPPLLPPCSSPTTPPARAARKHHLPVTKLAAPLSCCYATRARLAAPSERPCEPELAAASNVHAVHRPVSESLVSTLSSALSAELASIELLHAPTGQTVAVALPWLAACAPRPHVLPLLAKCLMKWRRGMSFLVTPSLVSTSSTGRTTVQGWCRWLPNFA